ncbi:hypothetical protein D1007_38543 [Hordeum vulgare]|nr:hypothetical protein D1007_38543 [Hordeum vulgare]
MKGLIVISDYGDEHNCTSDDDDQDTPPAADAYTCADDRKEAYLACMINENENPCKIENELEATTTFEVGTTSDPNPSKKKKKSKTIKARGLTFSRFEDILLVKAWLDTRMDSICGTEKKGDIYWEKTWKGNQEQKEYVEPHPIMTTPQCVISPTSIEDFSRGSEQLRWLLLTSDQMPSKWDASGNSLAATMCHELEKKPFAFSDCWVILNGKPKWTQLMTDLKSGKKRNNGSRSHQSIWLDDEEDDVVVTNGRAIVSKDRRQAKENKKEQRYKLMLDAQKDRMEWDQTRADKRLEIKSEKIELEKQEAAIEWELEKAKTFGEIKLEKERLQLARDMEDAKIMLADETLLEEHEKSGLWIRRRRSTTVRIRKDAHLRLDPAEDLKEEEEEKRRWMWRRNRRRRRRLCEGGGGVGAYVREEEAPTLEEDMDLQAEQQAILNSIRSESAAKARCLRRQEMEAARAARTRMS